MKTLTRAKVQLCRLPTALMNMELLFKWFENYSAQNLALVLTRDFVQCQPEDQDRHAPSKEIELASVVLIRVDTSSFFVNEKHECPCAGILNWEMRPVLSRSSNLAECTFSRIHYWYRDMFNNTDWFRRYDCPGALFAEVYYFIA
jgi:hypothetical protein